MAKRTGELIPDETTGNASSAGSPADAIAQAAEVTAGEMRLEAPQDPLAPGARPATPEEEAEHAIASFSPEDLNVFAGELLTFGRQLLAPKRPTWDFTEQEAAMLSRTGGRLLEKWMPKDLGPWTAEIAFGIAVVAYLRRAETDDLELRKKLADQGESAPKASAA